jgi:Ser/Thr protein kinase RdoA (MazF antagonist)
VIWSPAEVLACYPAPCRQGTLLPLGNRGGFSGACLWRLAHPPGSLCLRLWPADDALAHRLPIIHRLLAHARSQGLRFIPALLTTLAGNTLVSYRGRYWELTEWLPGRADYHAQSSTARLTAACVALAHLHLCWEHVLEPAVGVCPAVCRRLDRLRECSDLLRSGWRPSTLAPVVDRALRLLPHWVERRTADLRLWLGRTWSLQPCVCDLWHDHVLFEGDRLTGLVDFGAVKRDHPAVDLARLLGSLVEDDREGWRIGVAAYRTVRSLSVDEEEMARVLDCTGTVVGAGNWLRWLCHERREFEDSAGALQRMEVLVRRMERW